MNIIDIDATLDAAGGANDTVSETYNVNSDSAAFQVAIGGASGSVEIHFEARLTPDAAWVPFLTTQTVASGYADLSLIDLESVPSIRVRFVNTDGTNTATVRSVVRTT